MNSVPIPATSSPDETAVESGGREPLLLLLVFSVLWLLLSGVFALIASIQAHSPDFLADCRLFTYGHSRALAETAFAYGWMANAGLALVLWILGRLSGEPLRGLKWALVGTLFWNLAVAIGAVGIAIGDATSIPNLQMPREVQPLMLIAYGAIAIPGILAWTGRRRPHLFAAQWYGVALLFLFPWLFSLAQVMLLWAPVPGVVQAVTAGWYTQGLWTLWMAPLALAGAYYVVGKVTGRVLPGYDLAPLGFWCLLFVGGWTGGRHLIGGPVPAWIPTIGIVTSVMLLPHYIIVLLNLRGALHPRRAGADGAVGRSTALAFIGFGLVAYVLGGVVDAATGLRGAAAVTQFTWFEDAQQQLGVYAGISMMLFGTLYYALPRLAGRPWASSSLVLAHLGLSAAGLVLLVAGAAAAGLAQGHALNNPAASFADIAAATRPGLLAASAGQAALLLGNLLFALNFALTAATTGAVRLRAAAQALSS